MITTTARNANLSDLANLLASNHARKVDVVAPASAVRATADGLIVVEGAEPVLTVEGVTPGDGTYRPTAVFDEGVAEKLGIPIAYLRRMRETRPDLYAANINGLLHGEAVPFGEVREQAYGPDPRSFLVRAFRDDDGGTGVARALLSSSYRFVDDLDVLTATLGGVKDAGVDAQVESADLTERRMYVRITAPEVALAAPRLLRGYRSPFGGGTGDENPTVFAGFVISNSEVGNGAFSIVPRIVIQVCSNGLTVTKDAARTRHLGGRMEDGVVVWSDETQARNLDLIASKTKDAVRTFLSPGYLERAVASIEEQADTKIEDPSTVVQTVSKSLAYSAEVTAGVLDHFIRGGQLTAGGVMQAVTSFAQTVEDGDLAADLEASALSALDFAARL